MTHVGIGFDVHPFSPDRSQKLVLGGVVVAGARGLQGHSDADVVTHAVTDAILGAAGLGDLGSHFPDTDPEFQGADSIELMRISVRLTSDAGWRLVNADCAVVAEEPRLAPYLPAMIERLSAVGGGPVTVKAKRAEGLGSLGRAEGIACWAVALVEPR